MRHRRRLAQVRVLTAGENRGRGAFQWFCRRGADVVHARKDGVKATSPDPGCGSRLTTIPSRAVASERCCRSG
jgi:hypothetical protein